MIVGAAVTVVVVAGVVIALMSLATVRTDVVQDEEIKTTFFL